MLSVASPWVGQTLMVKFHPEESDEDFGNQEVYENCAKEFQSFLSSPDHGLRFEQSMVQTLRSAGSLVTLLHRTTDANITVHSRKTTRNRIYFGET